MAPKTMRARLWTNMMVDSTKSNELRNAMTVALRATWSAAAEEEEDGRSGQGKEKEERGGYLRVRPYF
jgi:hypothetical protein